MVMWASEMKMIREERSDWAVVGDEDRNPSGWEIRPGEMRADSANEGRSRETTSAWRVDEDGEPDSLGGMTPVD